MKNSFCRICRGRFNLKYPPVAVDSKNKKPSSRSIAVRIDENGEISDNICWDCEDTLLGFHRSVGEDDGDDEEPVVVDDDEILYKSLEKTRRRSHCVPKEVEIIEIDSSDSEHEERVTVPNIDEIVTVESANTVVARSRKSTDCGVPLGNNISDKKSASTEMSNFGDHKKDIFTRGKVFESMRCPLCPYLSGIEFEVVLHIRHSHPHYTGDHIRFEHRDDDSDLTRRIIFVHLWTFFECKACGKLHDRFWPHRKHLKTHDRKAIASVKVNQTNHNNNEVFTAHKGSESPKSPTLKRALSPEDVTNSSKRPRIDERVLRRTSKDNNSAELNEKLPTTTSPKSKPLKTAKEEMKKSNCISKKSKSKGLLRKQQKLQAKREKRRQKSEKNEKVKKSKSKPKPKLKATHVIPKPTFKMPQQPAPRAASIVKQLLQRPRFTCKLCSLTLTGFIGWNMHMLRVHPTEEFNHNPIIKLSDSICNRCDKTFSCANDLVTHFRLSHRRKNRLVEINGNDNEEICRQTVTPQKDRDAVDRSIAQPKNGLTVPLELFKFTQKLPPSALLCQYCGLLFAEVTEKDSHESSHASRAEVKRIFPLTKQL